MGDTRSALDPIFMMHHCNIDRIWAVWNVNNQNSNDPLWTDMTFQKFLQSGWIILFSEGLGPVYP
jgi:hypothetical protein